MSNAAAFEQVTDAQWQEDLDLKLFAAIRLTRLAWPQMKQQKWGRPSHRSCTRTGAHENAQLLGNAAV
jgi:NAD(P)-dependent dehydrogenase (short-subunit alcohol dehydrogenase family)